MNKFGISKKWVGLGAFVAGAGLGGAAVGTPGLKRQAAQDAALTAGVVGVGAMALHKGRVAVAKAFVNHGKLVFRRVRGRIIALKMR